MVQTTLSTHSSNRPRSLSISLPNRTSLLKFKKSLSSLSATSSSIASSEQLISMFHATNVTLQKNIGILLKAEQSFLSEENQKEAFNALRKAAHLGHIDSQYRIGDIYARRADNPHEQNPQNFLDMSIQYFTTAARNGSVPASYRLGNALYKKAEQQAQAGATQEIVQNTLSQSFNALFPVACQLLHGRANDDPTIDACYKIGNMYIQGRGTARDFDKALPFIEKAAEHNHPQAIQNLGIMYLNGLGTEKDIQKAKNCFEKIKTNPYTAEAAQRFLQHIQALENQ